MLFSNVVKYAEREYNGSLIEYFMPYDGLWKPIVRLRSQLNLCAYRNAFQRWSGCRLQDLWITGVSCKI